MKQDKKVIAEIAGRDSFAAISRFYRENEVSTIVPTYAQIATEYGDISNIEKNVHLFRQRLKKESQVEVAELIVLEKTELWWALNGRFLKVLNDLYGFYTPCLGCHLYAHLIRVPLANELGTKVIIGGEREAHGSKVKLNQIPEALNAYQEVLSSADFRLELPVRKVVLEEEIQQLSGLSRKAGETQVKCVFAANYIDVNGEVDYSREKVKRYLDQFLVPAGKKLAQALLEGQKNYLELVEKVIMAETRKNKR